MAGGGEAQNHPPVLPEADKPMGDRSWASIVGEANRASEASQSLVNLLANMERLKATVKDTIHARDDYSFRAEDNMKNVLYGKFLGKALPLDQVRNSLSMLWGHFGSFSIADLPNGFYFIRCQGPGMVEKLLWEGPWTVAGMVLQLTPWRENFQPAFEKLEMAAVWVQLHHLPMEFWDNEMFEDIGEHLGRLLKIDTLTDSVSRARFARLCVEIDLSQPLKQGFWIERRGRKAMVAILYERLPVFCFRCGRIGHGEAKCSMVVDSSGNGEAGRAGSALATPHFVVPPGTGGVAGPRTGEGGGRDAAMSDPSMGMPKLDVVSDNEYGIWMRA